MGSESGSNGTSTLLLVRNPMVEERDTGLVPYITILPLGALFIDQCIFVGVPQYYQHIQGAIGID